ncbi:MAG: hypothetical protein MZV70_76710 [Desulfobacterales bacterium]|nr:hypothetical protein [Desulfobacterales bacterium]
MGGISSYIGGRISSNRDNRLIIALSMAPSVPFLLGSLYLLNDHPLISFISFVTAGFIIMFANSVTLVVGQKATAGNFGVVSGLIGGFCWGIAGLLQSPIGFLSAKYGIANVLAITAFLPILATVSTFLFLKNTLKREKLFAPLIVEQRIARRIKAKAYNAGF